jgi:hypothetical protein
MWAADGTLPAKACVLWCCLSGRPTVEEIDPSEQGVRFLPPILGFIKSADQIRPKTVHFATSDRDIMDAMEVDAGHFQDESEMDRRRLTLVRVLSGHLSFGCMAGDVDGKLVTVMFFQHRRQRLLGVPSD